MREVNGIDATRQITSKSRAARVLAVSTHSEPMYVWAMINAGASGFVVKSNAREDLTRAIGMVMAGKLCLSPEVSASILEDYQKNLIGEVELSEPALSKRDKQLLRLITEGRRGKEIAAELECAESWT